MLYTKRVIALALLLACVLLAGCATTSGGDSEYRLLSSPTELKATKALRMEVAFGEQEGYYQIGLLERIAGKWGPQSKRYRWISAQAKTGNGGLTGYYLYSTGILVPDQVPTIHKGDLVDVILLERDQYDFPNLKAPLVLGLVCRKDDVACQDRLKASNGGKTWGVWVERAQYDQSKFTFTPRYDESGYLPKK